MKNETASRGDSPISSFPKLLTIYTSELSQEVDGVIDHLRSNGWEILRYNLCRYPEELLVSKRTSSPTAKGVHWLHSVPPFSTASTLVDLSREVSLRDCFSFWEGMWLDIEPSRWLNSPASISLASNKLHQLRRAGNLKITTPEWLITNSIEELHEFTKIYPQAVLKSLACGFIRHPSGDLKFFTRRAEELTINNSPTLLGPVIIQKRIEKKFEIRATVVAGDVYCSLLDYNKIPPTTDYRRLDFKSIKHAFLPCPSSLTTEIVCKSREIAASYGLRYAGIDWIIDNNNQTYFLELNPLGSFKWFEIVKAGDITSSLAMTFETIRNELSKPDRNL